MAVRNSASAKALSSLTRGLEYEGLTPSQLSMASTVVALIVKSAAKAMGREPAEFSGHSLRAGYVTTAAMASLPTWLIREQTGHRSDAVLARYIRLVEKRKIPSLL